ncbi:MAG: MFS transporter [Chloroflexota bacterium]
MSRDPAATAPPAAPGQLLSRGFVLLLAATLVGWTGEAVIQAVLPLHILDLGGDAGTVGLVALAFALPTIVLRPAVGRRIDRVGHGALHARGLTLGVAAAAAFVVAPLVALPAVRGLQGLAWAIYGTANNVAAARLAPTARRSEASGYFNVAYAAGFLVGPPVALLVYGAYGAGPAFAMAAVCIALAVLVVRRLRRHTPGADLRPIAAAPVAAPGGRSLRRALAGYLEPAAVPLLVVNAALLGGQGLFLTFGAVYARETGVSVGWLALLFPVFSLVNAMTQLLAGRLGDRLGRRRAILVGAALGAAGLVAAAGPAGVAGYLAGATLFAVGAGIVVPATAAGAMDVAPEGRLGATMATFSMSYQLSAGIGGALWGALILAVGYPWPFIVALAIQGIAVLLVVRFVR